LRITERVEAARQRRHVVCYWRLTDILFALQNVSFLGDKSGHCVCTAKWRTSCLVDDLALPARGDEWIPLRCVAFHERICLRRFTTIEAFLKTFKCCRATVQRHPSLELRLLSASVMLTLLAHMSALGGKADMPLCGYSLSRSLSG
jgi:hypothetical protein